VEDVGELDRDVAAAGNQDGLGQLLEVKRLVGVDAKLVAGQRRVRIGLAANRDENVTRRHLLPGCLDQNGIRSGQLGPRGDDLRPGIFQPVTVEPLQPVDLAILVGNQCRPVEAGLADPEAISVCILEMLVELRGVDEQLLGNTAANDAGSAEPVLFGDGHLLAQARRQTCCANAAGSATNDKQVEVEFAHVRISLLGCCQKAHRLCGTMRDL
jgi:hypothetical protein